MEPPGNAAKLPVEVVTYNVREGGGAWRTLRECVSRLPVDGHLRAAESGDDGCNLFRKTERLGLEGFPHPGLLHRREEIFDVGIEDVPHPDVTLGIVDDRLRRHESRHVLRSLVEGLQYYVGVGKKGFEGALRGRDRPNAAGTLRNGEGPVATFIALRVQAIVEKPHVEGMTLFTKILHLQEIKKD